MSEDSSTLNDLDKTSQATLDEAIKMPANFAEALAVLVQTLQSDNQLIGAVLLAIILPLAPILYVISTAQTSGVALLLAVVWCITITLVLSFFFVAFVLVRFREQGKQTFAAEHQEDLREQLLHAQSALIKLRNYVEPLDDHVTRLVRQRQIQDDSAAQLVGQLNRLKNYLEQEEHEINLWLGRLASAAEMDLQKAAKRRKARWDARRAARKEKRSLNSSQNRR